MSEFQSPVKPINVLLAKFLHSSVDGYLGYFHLLATVNDADMIVSVYNYLFQSLPSLLLGQYPEVEFLGHRGNDMFNFLRNRHAVFHSKHILHFVLCLWFSPVSTGCGWGTTRPGLL